MSDAALPPADLPGDAADVELIFDEPKPVMILVPVEADAAEPRRAPRRGRKAKDEAPAPEPVPAPSVPTASAGADPAAAEEPAGAPAPFPPQGVHPAGSTTSPWLLATVAFALLTSTASLGGLIAVGRTLSQAQTDRAHARDERDALAGVPQMIAHLDAASARLDAATQRLGVATPATPVAAGAAPASGITMADLHHELDALKLALGQRQPEGLNSLNGITRDGFSEVTTKLDRLGEQMAQAQRGGAKH